MILVTWAVKWSVGPAALADLFQTLGLDGTTNPGFGLDEASVQANVRLEAAHYGYTFFRNNIGAYKDEHGNFVRYGLANDSAQLNKSIKSGDLIGWKDELITPAMVGTRIARFASAEAKRGDWRYSGTPREVAQLKWNNIVLAAGGDARFVTGPGSFA